MSYPGEYDTPNLLLLLGSCWVCTLTTAYCLEGLYEGLGISTEATRWQKVAVNAEESALRAGR